MAQERLGPDAILGTPLNLSGSVTDIDDDPDTGDINWLTASGNNVSTDVRTSFGTPADPLTSGADLQEFRAEVRQFDVGQTGTPTARLELWEAGTLVRAGTDVNVTGSGQVIALTWNATEITAAADVEAKVVGTKSGGSPTARNSVEVGAVEWNADITIADVQIAGADAAHMQSLDVATFSQVHDLTIADLDDTQTLDGTSFAQVHDLAVAQAGQAHTLEMVGLSQNFVLTIASADHAHLSDQAGLGQNHILGTADLDHGGALDGTSFNQVHDLTIAAVTDTQTLDASSFSQAHILLLVDAGHGNALDIAVLVQNHILTPADALSGQPLEATGFSQLHRLTIQDLQHALSFDEAVVEPRLIGGAPAAFLAASLNSPLLRASEGGQSLRGSTH